MTRYPKHKIFLWFAIFFFLTVNVVTESGILATASEALLLFIGLVINLLVMGSIWLAIHFKTQELSKKSPHSNGFYVLRCLDIMIPIIFTITVIIKFSSSTLLF